MVAILYNGFYFIDKNSSQALVLLMLNIELHLNIYEMFKTFQEFLMHFTRVQSVCYYTDYNETCCGKSYIYDKLTYV